MLVWLTLPFYDFCGFRSVAVNSVYKLQFFTFILAVLLPVVNSLLIIMTTNTTFFDLLVCLKGQYASSCQMLCRSVKPLHIHRNFRISADAILDFFKFQIPNSHEGRTATPCQILLKSLKLRPRYGDFSIFQNGGRRHVGFLKLQIFNCGTHHKCRIASPCQISWRSVKPLLRYLDFGFFEIQISSKSVKRRPRYGDFSIFQDGGHRHLGFLKFQIFRSRDGQEGRTASACQISSKAVKPRPKYGDFSILQDGGHRHLGYSKFQIFNDRDVQEGSTASSCQMSSKSLKPRLRYGYFSIFF